MGKASIPAWRSVVYSIVTVVTILAGIELLLLAFGVSTILQREDPFRGFSRHVSVFEKDLARGIYTSDRPATRDTFNPQQFRIEKPPAGFRVFCIGGSSAYGFPWGAAAAFPAIVGDLLAAEHPGRVIEVVNAAGVSYASHRLRILAHELLRYEPDALIVYSGHNEFIEKSFYRSLRARAQAVGPLDRVRVRSRLVAVLSAGIDRIKRRDARRVEREGLELLVRRDRGEPISASEREELVTFFAGNLRAICRMAKARGVRVILCTTPSNLRDWTPARAPGHPALAERERARWQASLDAAEAAHLEERYDEALEHVRAALALAPEDAPSHYLEARCHEGLGAWASARAAYARACALDHALLRATDAINEATRAVAAEEKVVLVDVERGLEALSPHGLVGLDLIEDYVHPSRRGHEEIARLVWRAMREASIPDAPTAPDADALAASVIAARRDRVAVTENTPTYLYNQGLVLANQGRWPEALEKLESSLRLAPGFAEAHFHAGRVRESTGDLDGALGHYEAAQRIDPAFTEARYNLGVLLVHAGRLEEAAGQFEAVVRLDGRHADAFNNLAVVRTRQGRLEEAARLLEAALRAQPAHASARDNLERLRAHLHGGPPRAP